MKINDFIEVLYLLVIIVLCVFLICLILLAKTSEQNELSKCKEKLIYANTSNNNNINVNTWINQGIDTESKSPHK
jgi:preprotein translocase subunit SecG